MDGLWDWRVGISSGELDSIYYFISDEEFPIGPQPQNDSIAHHNFSFPSLLLFSDGEHFYIYCSTRVSIAMMKIALLCSTVFALTGCGVLLLFMFNIARKIEKLSTADDHRHLNYLSSEHRKTQRDDDKKYVRQPKKTKYKTHWSWVTKHIS